MPAEPISCINCNTEVSSDYCPNCGQKANIRPVSWQGLFEEFYSTWLGMDNKFARTVKGLVYQPATVINEYLEGNRVKYIGPLSYLVIMSAIFILTFEITGVSPKEFLTVTTDQFQMATFSEQEEISEDKKLFMEDLMRNISDNMRLMTGALIPFLALSMLILYSGRNYLQNFLIATFITAELIWLSVCSVIVYAISGITIQAYLTIPSLVYAVWIIAKLNPEMTIFWTWLKGFIVWCIGYIFFMIVIVISTVIYLFNFLP